jgi:ornithine cyclodeaminase
MLDEDLLILRRREVDALLAGQELEIIRRVRAAYEDHGREDSSLPHSTFLRFPRNPNNRIIALPAYLGGESEIAGMKWVASFPANLSLGLERASAVIVLNSAATGRPMALLEGTLISARRTAASAALAAQVLNEGANIARVGIIGCGVINFEVIRSLLAIWPDLKSCAVFDLNPVRAQQFKQRCLDEYGGVEIEIMEGVANVLRDSRLTSIATTALHPHISDLSDCPARATILHLSLRDLSPEIILDSDNVVDDIDHVCRAQTSVHLAEQKTGNRGFIRCALPQILLGATPARNTDNRVVVFSPFGLGVLDITVGKYVYELALAQSRGIVIESFCS